MKIEHGGNLEKTIKSYGGSRSEWLDISTGISPFSPAIPKLNLDDWQRLPEQSSMEELADIAKRYYGSEQNCAVTSGSQFLINHLPELLEGEVGIVEPTYGEYAASFARHKRDFTSINSLDDIGNAQSIIIANPNNPTGQLYTREALSELAAVLAQRGGYLVVDEAFCDVCEQSSMLIGDLIENLIVLKSLGKFFGLAGARIGFVFARDKILQQIEQLQGPWAVSGPSLAVAKDVLTSDHIREDLLLKITNRHNEMVTVLEKIGLEILGGTKLFTLIRDENAWALHEHLLTCKILTRKFDYNAHWLRLGLTRNQGEDHRLKEAILSFGDQ